MSAGKSGRPLGFTREKAVGAAMHLFWRRGYSAVSAKDLAEAMAIERSSFYNTFGSREAVFLEVLAAYAATAPDAPLDHVPAGEPVIPVVVSVLRGVCRVRAADPEARGCLVCNAIAEVMGADRSVGPVLEAAVSRRVASLEGLLRRAIRQAEIPAPPNVEAAAHSILAFLIGLNTLSKVVRDEASLWATCRQFLLGVGVPSAAIDNVPGPARRTGGGGRRRNIRSDRRQESHPKR